MESGVYGIRYHFVICGFSVAETENLGKLFLLGRALEFDHLERFDIGPKSEPNRGQIGVFAGYGSLICYPLSTLV